MPRKKKPSPDPLERSYFTVDNKNDGVLEVRGRDSWEVGSGQHNAFKCVNRCDRVLEWVFEQYFVESKGPVEPKKDILKSRRALNEAMELSGLFENINEQTVRKTVYPRVMEHITALRNGFDQYIKK